MSRSLLLSLLLLAACGDPCPTETGLPDGGVHDASAVDSSTPDLTSAREALPSCDPEWDPECGADAGDGGGTEPVPQQPVSYSMTDFSQFGAFENVGATGWNMVNCAAGAGVVVSATAKWSGVSGLAISRYGCGVESVFVKMPDTVWNVRLSMSADTWGRPCAAEGCLRVEVKWFDAYGNRVAGTPNSYLYPTPGWIGFSVIASRPYNATLLKVALISTTVDGQGLCADDVAISAE